MRKHLCPLAVVAILGCTTADHPGHLSGTVTWQGRPITMALVEAYTKPERDPNTPPVGETPSAEDGRFSLELPPGEYWVWARVTLTGESRDQRLVGEAVGNPVHIQSGGAVETSVLLGDATGFASATGPAGTGARGTVTGAPPRQVTVYAYSGRSDRPLGPGFRAAVPAAKDGSFQLDLAPGEYTLAARWRASGADHGALGPGDRVARIPATVSPGGYTELGTLDLQPVDPEVRRTVTASGAQTSTWVGGRVLDPGGNPRASVRVLAFDDPRMAGKPLALSNPTGTDGRFRVHLPGGGRYFLGARSRIGGPAEPGEWSGAFRGEGGDGLSLGEGAQQNDVEIQVEEVW